MTSNLVVLRSSWLVDALSSAPMPLIFWFVLFRHDGVVGSLVVAALYAAVTIQAHRRTRVVLTADGVELWRNGRTAMPWSYVGGVVFVGSPNFQRSVAILLPDRSVRPLPAPRSLFGIERHDVEYARDLIEQRWRHQIAKATSLAAPDP